MNTNHSPGPWTVESGKNVIFIYDSRPDIPSVAYVEKGMDHDGPANAHLIAAAPELLEALKALLEDYQGTLQAYNDYRETSDGMSPVPVDQSAVMAKLAIAKAEGQQ